MGRHLHSVLALPPTIFYTIWPRQGVYADEDVSVREQRNELYLFGLIWALIATALLSYIGAPQPFLGLLICALLFALINGGINLFWKIRATLPRLLPQRQSLCYIRSRWAWFCGPALRWSAGRAFVLVITRPCTCWWVSAERRA